MSNGVSGKRYLICSIRKSDVCRCGCKGFCSIGNIQRTIAWSFNCLADGIYPALDHTGRPFHDDPRATQRGLDLAEGWRGALTEFRAD
eukprot:1507955-Pyramimonas_sp.AAC.1